LSAYTNGVEDGVLYDVSVTAETGDGDNPDDGDSGEGGGGNVSITYLKKSYQYNIRFVISHEGQSVNVTNVDGGLKLCEMPIYLFYPDNNAKKAIIERYDEESGIREQMEISLTSHPSLQGCYWFGGFEPFQFSSISDEFKLVEERPEERRISNEGKIYTSEANNPFVFPLGGINTVGTGAIIGISTVTQALSQGQFGQFPLYVFSTEGLWAMEVGNDGLYSAVKPLSRDVCVNGDSITQTDNSVLFVSEKGVMQLDGSSAICISEMMDGRSFDPSTVCHLNDVLANENVSNGLGKIQDFMEYARSAKMAYDYSNSRVFLYNDTEDYSYVYSFKSGTWATVGLSISGMATDYPDVYVQLSNGIRNLSERIDYDSDEAIPTLIVTRPIKLGSDEYKTVYELVVRGAMDRNQGAVILWGSIDGENYGVIADAMKNRIYRTGGSGYRYFRVGIIGNMKVGETITSASVAYKNKYQNRLR
jgi:hypothetical protein